MKTHLRLFYYSLFFGLLCCTVSYAQINYSEDFESEEVNWTTDVFFLHDEDPCEGLVSGAVNLWELNPSGYIQSGSIGISNGQLVTLSYSYKIVDYLSGDAVLNSDDWGEFSISYGATATGPWTEIQSVNTTNHVESANCAVKTATFTPPVGNVYLRVDAEIDDDINDFYIYFDEVSATQPILACTGTPAAMTTVSSDSAICFNKPVTLSLNPFPTDSGLTFQWQSSTDGVEFEDVATGGAESTFETIQTVSTWYRALVTCSAGGDTVTSTPVEVASTGQFCYCEVDFTNGVEPITLVNFAGINNTTSATLDGTPALEDFSSIVGTVEKGLTYPITVKGNTGGDFTTHIKVFIDFNQDGDLSDAGESFVIGAIVNSTGVDAVQVQSNIAIPATALTGETRMRVFKLFNVSPASACGVFGYGQVEDYTLNITCNTEVPEAPAEQTFCSNPSEMITLANVDITVEGEVVWYADEEGGEPLTEDTVVEDGVTYYAAQIIDECESEDRAGVTITITQVEVTVLENVTTCEEYVLEPIEFGEYRTEADGAGDVLEAGAVIEEDATIYIYATEGECSAQSSFSVTITETDDLQGDAVQEFETGATVADLVVVGEVDAIINWYASQENANEGIDPLSVDTVLENDTFYYATQTVNDCSSDPFEVLVSLTLGLEGFNTSSLSYYPNPVVNELSVNYQSAITGIEVYNFLGQKVVSKTFNQTSVKLDMSGLSAGSYIMKVQTQDGTATVKVLKK